MRIVRVNGDSMLPRYRSGDYLLVGRYRYRRPKPGDDIVFRHADLGQLVKRIDSIDAGRISLRGLSAISSEPTSLGTLPAQELNAFERVLLRIPG